MISLPVLTTTLSLRGDLKRNREAAEAEEAKEGAKERMAPDPHPGQAPEEDPGTALEVLGALVAPAALEEQAEIHPEVPPEMDGKMSAEIICKGSAPGRIASSNIQPLAGIGRKAIAAEKIAITCTGWPRATLPESLLLKATVAGGAPKKRKSPKTRRARARLVGLLAANPKRKIKRIKRVCCAEPCLFAWSWCQRPRARN